MARSYESLWLWLGAGLVAVGAALLGVAGGLDGASKVPYSFWTSAPVVVAYFMFGLSLACFGCAIREVPIPYPISRRTAEPLVPAPAAPFSGGPGLPAAPVRVRLVAERDMATDGFRLVALNEGEPGRFRAEVISIRDQNGQASVTPAGGWPIPWLDDGSVTAKDIPMAGSLRLDFAHFRTGNLHEGLEGTKRADDGHWTFPSLPAAVKVSYPAAHTWEEQDQHFSIVTVRVSRDAPAGHADTEFKIGTERQEPYCRKLTADSDAPGELAEKAPAPEPAVTGRWTSTSQFVSGDLLQLQNNGMSHPAYMRRSPQDPPPASLRIGIVIACAQLPRDTPPTSSIRSSFLAFLAWPEIMDLIAELTDTTGMTWKAWDERPRFNFGAVLSGDDESKTPAAWARLLLPETWASHFGRDPRYANLVLYVEPRTGPDGRVAPAGVTDWHRRFARAARLPAALAGYLSSDLGLTTSADPAAELAVWLKARGTSLTELVDVSGFTVVPGAQANWFIGLASAAPQGQDVNNLARTWTAEICDSMHLDGHETVLRSLRTTGLA